MDINQDCGRGKLIIRLTVNDFIPLAESAFSCFLLLSGKLG